MHLSRSANVGMRSSTIVRASPPWAYHRRKSQSRRASSHTTAPRSRPSTRHASAGVAAGASAGRPGRAHCEYMSQRGQAILCTLRVDAVVSFCDVAVAQLVLGTEHLHLGALHERDVGRQLRLLALTEERRRPILAALDRPAGRLDGIPRYTRIVE